MRLIFPCGAFFSLKTWPVDGSHYARDGAIRMCVSPGDQPYTSEELIERMRADGCTDYRGERAPCQDACPVRKRRREVRGFTPDGDLDAFVFCHARLYSQEHLEDGDEGWYDITPMPPSPCPHCVEQRTYEVACRQAARRGTPTPDRRKWRVCSQCGRSGEIEESGCRYCHG